MTIVRSPIEGGIARPTVMQAIEWIFDPRDRSGCLLDFQLFVFGQRAEVEAMRN